MKCRNNKNCQRDRAISVQTQARSPTNPANRKSQTNTPKPHENALPWSWTTKLNFHARSKNLKVSFMTKVRKWMTWLHLTRSSSFKKRRKLCSWRTKISQLRDPQSRVEKSQTQSWFMTFWICKSSSIKKRSTRAKSCQNCQYKRASTRASKSRNTTTATSHKLTSKFVQSFWVDKTSLHHKIRWNDWQQESMNSR